MLSLKMSNILDFTIRVPSLERECNAPSLLRRTIRAQNHFYRNPSIFYCDIGFCVVLQAVDKRTRHTGNPFTVTIRNRNTEAFHVGSPRVYNLSATASAGRGILHDGASP